MALFAIIALVFTVGAKGSSTPVQETIVCFGDSLTSGYSITSPGSNDKSKAWPALLQNKVNIPVINAGKSQATTTADGLARVKKDVLSHNPRIVIIEYGANDWQQKVPMDTIKNNLQKIIDMVNDGNRKIYLASFFPRFTPKEQMEFRNMYETLASSNNIQLVSGIFDSLKREHWAKEK